MLYRVIRKIRKITLKGERHIRLRNKGVSLIANNCCGGVIYHLMGEQFRSPTINLFFRPDDYLLLLENLQEAITADIREIETDKTGMSPSYPLGEITLKNGGTIEVHFMHYKSFEQAVGKWKERAERVDYDKLYIFMELGPETSEEYVARFEKLPYKHKVVLTSKEIEGAKSALCIDIYNHDFSIGKIFTLIPSTPHYYIELFDFLLWFNTGEIRRARFYHKYIK
jgi:uncharacterized protein (DUF1919 family)